MNANYSRRKEGRKGETGKEELSEGGSMAKLERPDQVADSFPVLYSKQQKGYRLNSQNNAFIMSSFYQKSSMAIF